MPTLSCKKASFKMAKNVVVSDLITSTPSSVDALNYSVFDASILIDMEVLFAAYPLDDPAEQELMQDVMMSDYGVLTGWRVDDSVDGIELLFDAPFPNYSVPRDFVLMVADDDD